MSVTSDQAVARRARGVASYARVLDVPDQQVPATLAARVGPGFAKEALQAAGGLASSPILYGREHSIAVLTALVAQGVSGDRLSTHLQLGRKQGLDDEVLTAVMVLLANYVGYPRASLAMEAVHASSANTSSANVPPAQASPARAGTAPSPGSDERWSGT